MRSKRNPKSITNQKQLDAVVNLKKNSMSDSSASKELEKIQKQRETISSSLKAVVSATRNAYKKAKSGLDSSYEQTYQQEYDKILKEFPSVKKRKK